MQNKHNIYQTLLPENQTKDPIQANPKTSKSNLDFWHQVFISDLQYNFYVFLCLKVILSLHMFLFVALLSVQCPLMSFIIPTADLSQCIWKHWESSGCLFCQSSQWMTGHVHLITSVWMWDAANVLFKSQRRRRRFLAFASRTEDNLEPRFS